MAFFNSNNKYLLLILTIVLIISLKNEADGKDLHKKFVGSSVAEDFEHPNIARIPDKDVETKTCTVEVRKV